MIKYINLLNHLLQLKHSLHGTTLAAVLFLDLVDCHCSEGKLNKLLHKFRFVGLLVVIVLQ